MIKYIIVCAILIAAYGYSFASLVITEVFIDGSDEYIEIYNQ
jgi:hypothetical protein